MIEVVEYLDADGRSPFARWFDGLDRVAAAKVAIALVRMGQGNLAHIKSLGGGLAEYRIDVGPGFRLYLHRHGDRLIILFCGGTKRGQDRDIARARAYLADFEDRYHKGSPTWR